MTLRKDQKAQCASKSKHGCRMTRSCMRLHGGQSLSCPCRAPSARRSKSSASTALKASLELCIGHPLHRLRAICASQDLRGKSQETWGRG